MNSEQTNEEYLTRLFNNSSDITIEKQYLFSHKEKQAMLVIYCNGLTDNNVLLNYILPDIQNKYYNNGLKGIEHLNSSKQMHWSKKAEDVDVTLLEKVFNGFTVIVIAETIYFFNIPNPPKRSIEESNSEVSVRGPRDAFVEDIGTNIALVRKRIKSKSLVTTTFVIGARSQTQVKLVYLVDIQNKKMIKEVIERLNNIDIDFLNGDNQLLGILGDNNYSLFPLLKATSRPDGVVSSLAVGRFAIFIDNSPNVLLGPANLGLLLKTAEDEHTPYYYGTFELILRLFGLIIALFLPSFWVALSSFNADQIPFPLLASVASSRIGIPFNATFEMLLMLTLFELFREAGVRLPKAVGQTVAVVGGLIVGNAAIQAGITSPTMLVISSLTAVATFTLGNQAIYGTVSILRFSSILFSSVFGMFGFFISLFAVLGYLAKLESFGLPYLSPVSPFSKRDFLKSVLKRPVVKQNERASTLNPIDKDRQGDGKN